MTVITLIGYRGSGKSSVAAPLAERLSFSWIDADDEIERAAGKSISQIFADEGETHFRQIERTVMQSLLSRDKLIIAAGGGAILNAETRQEVQDAGPVVWLKADVNVLEQRVSLDESTTSRRPALTSSGSQREEIQNLLDQREPIYQACASITVDTDSKTILQIVDEITDALDFTP
ncbi:MAG: shikimate kinase [Planctomycetes bacterium]|nr:shikimate kinase [Planctomycetota bacterium]MCH9776656.1 shikimate kinase [Planctomycetota bacterium]MCH9793601.1 shikimate kinase [Planctomycetota bacterium]MDF1746669.1 shikimate kinase [Gimesia sp.]